MYLRCFVKFAREQGFVPRNSEPCLFIKHYADGSMTIMSIYVDDITIGGDDDAEVDAMKKALLVRFVCKDLGRLSWIVGIKVTREGYS